MIGRLCVFSRLARRRTVYVFREFCAEAELLVEDGNKSRSCKPIRPLYFDFQASTQLDPRVLDAMLPFYISHFGNPHSRTHEYGWYCEEAVEKARENVANQIGADHKEIIFTSGATESNNLAVKGVAKFYHPKKKHIITTQIEHKCVLDSCRVLENNGFGVTYLPVQKNGILDLEVLERSIKPETSLVSVIAVNNEIGVLQPIEEIGRLCRSKGVFFHTDAAQAFGKVPIDVNAMNFPFLFDDSDYTQSNIMMVHSDISWYS
ncbi:unnamed protein product [Schistosoma margrebowiei]|uniref:Aminotransferase class V domain-containing protein n=1 Tax=Schistosoma margrebowiei TaxID=48269 RepID=A0AA84Z864_9TREM|nr:unnamed protein product [Schistosoma margrebowiei]